MKIDIITIFPDMYRNVFSYGILSKAIIKKLVDINIHNLRDFSKYNNNQVDDRPFGGGPGMVLMIEPLTNAINKLKSASSKIVYLTPKGKNLTQKICEKLVLENHLIIICGRYEGIDQRIIDNYVDIQISIGDYILSGGEFASMVLIDSITRLIPGVIENSDFNDNESFSDKNDRKLLDYPSFTRPEDYKGLKVPDVLLSGNHEKIKRWRKDKRVTKS